MFWNKEEKIHEFLWSGCGIKNDDCDFVRDDRKIVLAPGCFDLLHYSHIDYLQRAALLGQRLVVGLNSDYSVSHYKPGRPIIPQKWRARQLAALECVSDIIIFDQETPKPLIEWLKPQIVVVGGEWASQNILQEVTAKNFGQVVYLPVSEDHISTTALIEKLKLQK